VKRVHFLPIIFALLVSATVAFSQTTYLGNILQLHRQDAGSLPAATNYQGAVVYDTGGNTVWYSNGTSWQPIASGGGGGGGIWVDAGTGGVATVPPAQVRVGRTGTPDVWGIYASAVVPSISSGAFFTDGGTGLLVQQARANSWTVASQLALVTSTSSLPPTMSIQGWNAGNVNQFTNLHLRTNGVSDGQIANIFLTSGSLGAYRNGMNYTTDGPGGHHFHANGSQQLGNPPAFSVVDASQVRVFSDSSVASTAMTFGAGTLTNFIANLGNNQRIDFGTGANDWLASDGTRLVQGDGTAGGINAHTYRVVGNTNATTNVTATTTGNGGIGFRQSDSQHYMMKTNRNFSPILSGPDWVYDGRTWLTEVTHEATACPVQRQASVLAAGGGDTTVFCHDPPGSPGGVVVGTGHPAQPYRTFNTTTVAGQRSIFGTFTTSAPATGVSQSPQTFTSRRAGPVYAFRLRTGSAGWTSNITWYAGLFSLIPATNTPTANSVYVRFDTANPPPSATPDTRFRLCACVSSTCTCSNFSVAPAINTEYLFEVDCRESSTACYGYLNGTYETSVTTNLPGLATNMGWAFGLENVDAVARSAGLGRLRLRQE
jgi:hypothetical protein